MCIDETNEIKVCKTAFCLFFGIDKAVIERIFSKLKHIIPSRKGLIDKHINTNKLPDNTLFQLSAHIQTFLDCVSHYSRQDNNAKH